MSWFSFLNSFSIPNVEEISLALFRSAFIPLSGLLIRSRKAAKEFLLENMRMDEDVLRRLNTEEMTSWIKGSLKEESLSMVANAIQEL
jgi:hypothetical protein